MNVKAKLHDFFANSKHVMSVSYKPGTAEFRRTLKIVLVGTLIIGILGYIVSIIIGMLVHI